MEMIDSGITMERFLMRNAKKNKNPINGSLELLPLCNMNCKMCYSRLSNEEMKGEGRIRTVEEWLTIADEMKEEGLLFLLLTGGEPLLYPDFKRLYLELRKRGFVLSINTNGTLIDEQWARFFGENKPRRVNITLYGSSNETYMRLCNCSDGFSKTIKGIELLKQWNVDVKIAGSITELNIDDVEELYTIGRKFRIPVKLDSYMLPVKRTTGKGEKKERLLPEQVAAVMIRQMKEEMDSEQFVQFARSKIEDINAAEKKDTSSKMKCMAGSCSFAINWKGEIKPCVIWPFEGSNVFEVGFRQAWNEVVQMCDKVCLNEKCSNCSRKNICRICTVAEALEEEKNAGVPEYLCKYAVAMENYLRNEIEI